MIHFWISGLALCSFEDEDECYIDNECSHHMAGEKNKFESPKKNKDGKFILGNSAPTKVLGKGRAKLDKYTKEVDALLVQGLNHNIISVGKIECKGHIIVFTLTKCKIIKEDTGKVIERQIQTNYMC